MKGPIEQVKQREGLTPWQHIAVFLVAFAVNISRQLDAVFRPQFWAEAGHVFFAEAYNLGPWHSLTRTLTGYYQTLPRLAAAIALLVPLALAPLVMNLVAICVQCLPVNLLLSVRSSEWGSLRFRATMAFIFLALPNCTEVAWIVSSQWLFGLSAFLVVVASTPKSRGSRIFYFCFVALCGISGPFCVPLLPISIYIAWKRPETWRRITAGILLVSCLVQAWGLFVIDPVARSHNGLGGSISLLLRILGGQIVLGTLIGMNSIATIPGLTCTVILGFIAVLGIAAIAVCFLQSSLPMRMFLVFACLLLIASLLSPTGAVPVGSTPWQALANGPGVRYWFFPTLALAWSLLWLVTQPNRAWRNLGSVALCFFCLGVVRDWRRPQLADNHFNQYVKLVAAAAPGATVTIPLNPSGWNMQLVKRPQD